MNSSSDQTKKRSWEYIKKYYPEYRSKNKRFAELLDPYLAPEKVLLDLGCGRGLETERIYKDLCKYSYGVDPSEAAFQNNTVHEALIGSAYSIPLENEAVDVVVSQQVLEHIEFPDKMFSEVSRVLRPGGIFAAMTPNLWYPTTVIASLTPYSFHLWVTNKLLGIDEDDTFPTFYRANRISTLRRLGEEAGFATKHSEYFMCNPGQFDFSPFLTWLEVGFVRLLDSSEAFRKLRDIVIIVYQK